MHNAQKLNRLQTEQIIKLFNIKYLIYSTKSGLKKCKASELNTSYLSSGQKAILENRIPCFVSNYLLTCIPLVCVCCIACVVSVLICSYISF